MRRLISLKRYAPKLERIGPVFNVDDDLIIDPTRITVENMPQILGAIVVELRRMNNKIDQNIAAFEGKIEDRLKDCERKIEGIEEGIGLPLDDCTERRETNEKRLLDVEAILSEHEKILWGPLKLTTKQILPLIWKYKLFVGVSVTVLTLWIAGIDWIVRGAQWTLQPPIVIP